MQMKHLQKDFYQILSTNRAYLDPESIFTSSSIRSSLSDFNAAADFAGVRADAIGEVDRLPRSLFEIHRRVHDLR
ncbi:unnamed protein product [Linum trigynum]|uniref:Uncharacterized protein n=1 Tax=Linum trigynum TaxID=586398 RepID=A0AAV2CFX8_9ROSI